jgi:hypothetical protein
LDYTKATRKKGKTGENKISLLLQQFIRDRGK